MSNIFEEERPASVAEAFANTAKALEQFKVERIRIEGLSSNSNNNSVDTHNYNNNVNLNDETTNTVRVITEQAFMREFVFQSRPCVIVGALDNWPAIKRWRDDKYLFDLDGHLANDKNVDQKTMDISTGNMTTTLISADADGNAAVKTCDEFTDDYNDEPSSARTGLCESKKEDILKRVTVALTPNGRADAITYVTYSTNKESKSGVNNYINNSSCNANNENDNDSSNIDNNSENENSVVVTEKLFMCPAEVRATLPELYHLLHANPSHPPAKSLFVDLRHPAPVIAYAQMQNNCLELEYQHLHADICNEVDSFGERVFGEPHEAANLWLGTPASVSSMHQDWVENLYAVVRGVKEFILVPPWEGVFVPKPEIPSAAFSVRQREEKGGYVFDKAPVHEKMSVPWADVEITPAHVDDVSLMRADLRDRLHPLVVYVHPGELLYLPAMWLHRVAQHADEEDICAIKEFSTSEKEQQPPLPLIAAVNYWYNMSFTNPAVVMLREFGLLL